MRLLLKLIGLALLLVGIYFLGQNIIFTTQTAPYWWRDISAAGSVLAVTSGVLRLLGKFAVNLQSLELQLALMMC